MEITVKISIHEEDVRRAAQDGVTRAMAGPSYPSGSGAGAIWQEIGRQTAAHVAGLDWGAAVREAAARIAPGIVERVVEAKLRAMARNAAKTAVQEGTLL